MYKLKKTSCSSVGGYAEMVSYPTYSSIPVVLTKTLHMKCFFAVVYEVYSDALLKIALCNFFTGCKQRKKQILDARNSSLQELA